ncbi:hypothetical protein KIPB_017289, partial [Kipferlia bialata]
DRAKPAMGATLIQIVCELIQSPVRPDAKTIAGGDSDKMWSDVLEGSTCKGATYLLTSKARALADLGTISLSL